MQTSLEPKLLYYFSIHCGPETIQSSAVGDVPGGHRIHVTYRGGAVTTDPRRYAADWLQGEAAKTFLEAAPQRAAAPPFELGPPGSAPEWRGFAGTILSGGDWGLVTRDGTSQYDGRLTLRADDKFLVDAVFRGSVDMRPDASPLDRAEEVYQRWLKGSLGGAHLRGALSMRFEASGDAPAWAAPRYRAAAEHAYRYRRLVRGEFVAIVEAETYASPRHPIKASTFDVYEVR